jgi:hypothetical protein
VCHSVETIRFPLKIWRKGKKCKFPRPNFLYEDAANKRIDELEAKLKEAR